MSRESAGKHSRRQPLVPAVIVVPVTRVTGNLEIIHHDDGLAPGAAQDLQFVSQRQVVVPMRIQVHENPLLRDILRGEEPQERTRVGTMQGDVGNLLQSLPGDRVIELVQFRRKTPAAGRSWPDSPSYFRSECPFPERLPKGNVRSKSLKSVFLCFWPLNPISSAGVQRGLLSRQSHDRCFQAQNAIVQFLVFRIVGTKQSRVEVLHRATLTSNQCMRNPCCLRHRHLVVIHKSSGRVAGG